MVAPLWIWYSCVEYNPRHGPKYKCIFYDIPNNLACYELLFHICIYIYITYCAWVSLCTAILYCIFRWYVFAFRLSIFTLNMYALSLRFQVIPFFEHFAATRVHLWSRVTSFFIIANNMFVFVLLCSKKSASRHSITEVREFLFNVHRAPLSHTLTALNIFVYIYSLGYWTCVKMCWGF